MAAFQGHSRSLELTRIDRIPMTSYLRSVVTVALSCSFRDIRTYLPKIANFFTRSLFNAPEEGFPSEIDSTGRTQENGMMGLTDRDGCLAISVQNTNVTDRHTDIQTERHRPTHSVER